MNEILQKAREYEEKFGAYIADGERPVFHLSPRIGWMNDPNGMFSNSYNEWQTTSNFRASYTAHAGIIKSLKEKLTFDKTIASGEEAAVVTTTTTTATTAAGATSTTTAKAK